MKYLVHATKGPAGSSPAEARRLLEDLVIPTMAALSRLEYDGKILGGGLPVGDRALAFILEAASHDEVDRILRSLPLWGFLTWKVVPLQSFADRGAMDRDFLKELL
jgi:muconolactone delta-isomerase